MSSNWLSPTLVLLCAVAASRLDATSIQECEALVAADDSLAAEGCFKKVVAEEAASLADPPLTNPNDVADECARVVPQRGRDTPQYVGAKGYIASAPPTDDKIPPTPWWTRELVQVGPKVWGERRESRRLEHKTPVVVQKQFLSDEGFGRYSGMLEVSTINDARKVYRISVGSFTARPYWQCDLSTLRYERVLAKVVGPSRSVRAVDDKGLLVDVPGGRIVLCGVDPGLRDGLVSCRDFTRRGSLPIYFEPSALRVIY